jgi:pyruvate carboxylase
MLQKLVVANRGEIAIRAFRAAYELGITTVAVYPWEDRTSLHRQKADEAYQIGEPGSPVRAYLDVAEVIRVARQCGADSVYPGYGFLSENPALAEACADAGLVFVGPSAEILTLAGNKVNALRAARQAGLPVLVSTAPSADADALVAGATEVGFPLFVKAASGGGGRGRRRVDRPEDLEAAVSSASREADAAFGDPTVYLEEALVDARHIEVQVLGDHSGRVVHLYERECSVQRRHQKLIEIAPAPDLDAGLRDRLCADAVHFARSIGYVGAGTVEFLVAGERYVFIEMNPRIQVEHTVTEETTDVDLVQAQLRIAGGETLAQLGLTQDGIRQWGAALQCRITTEDPANGFRPDAGTINVYRAPGGAGVRLDGGTIYAGAEVSAHFDSLLVKLICHGRDFAAATTRARRALAEFRIRGVATNLAFLQAILADPDFLAGRITTAFVDSRPDLLVGSSGADRGSKLLTYLAEMTVNKPFGAPPARLDPVLKLPALPDGPPPPGSRAILTELGPAGFAAWLRAHPTTLVTDTTFRDAHQSLIATRLRTFDMAAVAAHVARLLPRLLSLEMWGGATYDVALRFLREDPWARLETLRQLVPNLCFQMLLRGRNTVGYTPYPEVVTRRFVEEAAAGGIDIFRIFDALNDIEQMRPAIAATVAAGAVAEGAMCYAGNLLDPAETRFTVDYYLRYAEQMVEAGVHVLAIKDMAGLLRPAAAQQLVTALRERFDHPLHLHTHDTAGGQVATLVAAMEAGVDAVDGAIGPFAGGTSQPALATLVAATDHTPLATGLSFDALLALEPYWEAVRDLYAPFEGGIRAPAAGVYRHEIPGGQLTNLRQQAAALGLGDRFEEVQRLYIAADRLLGGIIKVTPTSKVVGDLALYLCASGVDPDKVAADPGSADLPDSVVGFLSGELGSPPGGWPEPFRTKALAGRTVPVHTEEVPAAEAEVLAQPGEAARGALNRLLFPGPTKDFETARQRYGDLSVLPTKLFLYGLEPGEERHVRLASGVNLLVELDAVGDPDARGMRIVLCKLNGQFRPLTVRDLTVEVAVVAAEKADPANRNHVAAPFDGVVSLKVSPGDTVKAGEAIATIEAMKMESTIGAPLAGTVERVAVADVGQVRSGDLLLVLR